MTAGAPSLARAWFDAMLAAGRKHWPSARLDTWESISENDRAVMQTAAETFLESRADIFPTARVATKEEGADPSPREIGLIYNLGAAMIKIGSLRRFVKLAEEQCADRHGACIYCARFLPLRHAQGCPLTVALEALELEQKGET
jgi:hypothetical protein